MKKNFLLLFSVLMFFTGFSQNVGIGTATPFFRLDVRNGSINTDSVYRIGGNAVLSVKGTQNTNTFVGIGGGRVITTGSNNTSVGSDALLFITSGSGNTATGLNTLLSNSGGSFNTAAGMQALYNNISGNGNTAMGVQALFSNENGISNTAYGINALLANANGNRNTAIGTQALSSGTSGDGNVALGFNAAANAQSSNKLYIENSAADSLSSLIYGDFLADSLLLNAKTINKFSFHIRGNHVLDLGYGTNKDINTARIGYGLSVPNTLDVFGGGISASGRSIKFWSEGGSRFTGNIIPDVNSISSTTGLQLGTNELKWRELWAFNGVIQTSDALLKKNISNCPYGLKEIMKIESVIYQWRADEPGSPYHIGVIAQQVQPLIPEAVIDPGNGEALSMKYAELTPVLIKAVQEQQEVIGELKKQNTVLLDRIIALENKLGNNLVKQ